MDMNKTNKEIVVFIVIFTLVLLWGLFKAPQVQEPIVGGLDIKFENGTTEPEVKAILEDCNMTINYSMDYNTNTMGDKYYILVDKDKRTEVKDELKGKKIWTDIPDIIKGNYVIIDIPEEVIHNESFLRMLDKYNLQLKEFVWCYVDFGNESKIRERDALKIKNRLLSNEKVLAVSPEYYSR